MKQSKIFKLLLVTVLLTFSLPLSPTRIPLVNAATEDFSTYIKGGAQSSVITTQNATHIGATVMERQDEVWVYNNLGAGNELTGNFKHTFAFIVTGWDAGDTSNRQTANLLMYHASRANDVLQCKTGSNSEWIEVVLKQSLDNNNGFNLQLNTLDDTADTTASLLSLNTWYYLNITRSGTTGTLYIYTDSSYSSLFDTLTIAGANDNYLYLIYAQGVDDPSLDITDDWSGYIKNLDLTGGGSGSPTGDYFENIADHDKAGFYLIDWTCNVTGSHSVEFGTDATLSTSTRSEWDNSTTLPSLYLVSTDLPPNATIYYRPEVYNASTGSLISQGSIYNFSTAMTAGDIKTGFQVHDDVIDLGYAPQGSVFYDSSVSKFYLMTVAQAGGSAVNCKESIRGIEWVDYSGVANGNIVASFPSGYDKFKTPILIKVGSTYYLYCGIQATATGDWFSGLWTGSGLDSLAYQGVVLDNTEVSRVNENFRIFDVWYNTSDSKFYAFVGGGDDSHGDWEIVYPAKSSDASFIGDIINTVLIEEANYSAGTWADSFNYPPRGVWDSSFSRYIGLAPACGSATPDYEFDNDLVQLDNPLQPWTTSNMYSDPTSAAHGYGETVLGRTDPNKHGMTKVDNEIYLFQFQYGTDYVWLYTFKAFFEDMTIRIDEGYVPKVHLDGGFPTMAQLKSPLDINVYTEDRNATLEITDFDKTNEYVKIQFEEYGANQKFYVNLKDFSTNTLYLHLSEDGSGNFVAEVNTTPTDANKTLTPSGSGNDFLFNFNQMTYNTAPSATTLEITNPTDGIFIMAGSGTGYTLRVQGTDADGASDISTLHGCLFFDDTHRLNVSVTGSTVTFPEGEDYVIHGGETISIEGNVKTVDIILAFKETTPIVNNVDGYLKVTDASSATSGWISFSDVISTMLYEEDGGGGGVPSPPSGEDDEGDAEDGEVEETEKEIWWREPEEYLIEFKNPLDPTKTINLIPIPWDWTHAQKMSSLFILWLLLFLILAYGLDEMKKTRNERRKVEYLKIKPIKFDYGLVRIEKERKKR